MTTKQKIAIACQGGGSHTAFTAGVLKKLLEVGVHETYDLVALSGTSGGAICATATWYGLLKAANGSKSPPYKCLVDFWKANSANSPWEKAFNSIAIGTTRLQQDGIIPSYPANPYQMDWMNELLSSMSPRKDFLNFKLVLENYIDFDEIKTLIQPSSPRLYLGAVDILSGSFKVFDSNKPSDIRVEALMASASVPNIFKAIEMDGTAYWDGLFSQNPPVTTFFKPDREQRPDEIWLIMINPTKRKAIPQTGPDIIDRRNELGGNISLYQEIRFIKLINRWIEKGAFKKEFMDKLKPVQIRLIELSDEIADRLDYTSKLERDAAFIERLMDEGEKQATKFLK